MPPNYTEFRVDVNNVAEAKTWLKKYEDDTNTTWRVRKTFPFPPDGCIFKVSQNNYRPERFVCGLYSSPMPRNTK